MRPCSIALAALVTVALTSACGGEQSAAPSCSGPPEITVDDHGAEPRATMEFTPAEGDVIELDMVMVENTSYAVDGAEPHREEGVPIEIGTVLTVSSVTADAITTVFEYDHVDVLDESTDISAFADELTEVSGTVVTDRFGAFVDSELDEGSSDLFGTADQQFEDLTTPVPTEPVGVGAVWQVESVLHTDGATFCQTMTHTLTAFDGESYEVQIEGEQEAVPGTVESDDGPPYDVVSGTGTSTGTSAASLSSPLAVSGKSTSSIRLEASYDEDGEERGSVAEIDIEMSIAPRS